MGMTELILVVPGMKVNGQYYCDVFLSQQMLPAIKHVASDTFVFQQDNAPSHRAKDTIKLLQQEMPDFSGPDLWPQNIPDLNIVDYKVWGVMQQRVHDCRMNSVDETVCSRTLLSRSSTSGESNWERACMQMDNILNIYCERVCLTKVMHK